MLFTSLTGSIPKITSVSYAILLFFTSGSYVSRALTYVRQIASACKNCLLSNYILVAVSCHRRILRTTRHGRSRTVFLMGDRISSLADNLCTHLAVYVYVSPPGIWSPRVETQNIPVNTCCFWDAHLHPGNLQDSLAYSGKEFFRPPSSDNFDTIYFDQKKVFIFL